VKLRTLQCFRYFKKHIIIWSHVFENTFMLHFIRVNYVKPVELDTPDSHGKNTFQSTRYLGFRERGCQGKRFLQP
jgi:hypothetical protein